MDDLLWHMKRVYGVKTYDWMHFKITRDNPLTFHHIKKDADGGKKDVHNGALLTKLAQEYLHQIERDAYDIYERINEVLLKINQSKRPITKKEELIIEELLHMYEDRCSKLLRSRIKEERISSKEIKKFSKDKEIFSPTNIRIIMQSGVNPKIFGQKHRINKRTSKKNKKR